MGSNLKRIDEHLETTTGKIEELEYTLERIEAVEEQFKNIDGKVVSLDEVMKAQHDEKEQKLAGHADRLQSLEEFTAELENKSKKLDSKLVSHGAELKRGLNGLENDQLPSVVNPLLEQLNYAKSDISDLKKQLSEKATLVQMDELSKELEGKSASVEHDQLVNDIE